MTNPKASLVVPREITFDYSVRNKMPQKLRLQSIIDTGQGFPPVSVYRFVAGEHV